MVEVIARRRRRWWELTLRWKIILLVTGVAFGVLSFSAWESYDAHRPESRGRFLRKHYNRFDEYRLAIGRSLAANAAFIALDPSLVAALSARDRARAGTVAVAAGQNLVAATTGVGQAVANHAETPPNDRERIAAATRRSLEPDLVLVVDRTGTPVGDPTEEVSEVSDSRLVVDLLSGVLVASELALVGEHVYQLSGAPVRDADGDVVGAVVIGQRIERYFHDYQLQSDPDITKQHRLTLVGRQGAVLASVYAEDELTELAAALDPEALHQAAEGDEMVPVVDLHGDIYDIWTAPVRGYAGQSYDELGTIYLMRTRDFKDKEFDESVVKMILMFVGVGLAAVLIGMLFSFFITRRINRYVAATEDLARGRGDLTKRLDAGGSDELGHLAHNLNAVFGYIDDLAAKVQSSAFQVGASSAEISAASKQMLEGAQEQARKTEGSSAAVTELSASIQQVAENAMEATRVARSSGEAVQGAIARMNQIRETVEDAAGRIQELGESGKRIGNIVEVIRQISDQTTLLALNAAIEAAHAGEQGRGFAVVADEVSSLAKRVGQSARDIEDLIATIKEQTSDAVRAMEAGTREVEAGTTLVTDTLRDLRTLVGVVEDTAQAVQEQAVASDEIARNMDVVQRIAADVLDASEEAVSQGDHLHRLAHALEQSVKGFKISALPLHEDRGRPRPALPSGDHDGAPEDGAG